jgi:hypothetical protein
LRFQYYFEKLICIADSSSCYAQSVQGIFNASSFVFAIKNVNVSARLTVIDGCIKYPFSVLESKHSKAIAT